MEIQIDRFLEQTGLNWDLNKVPIVTAEGFSVPNAFALVRSDTREPLAISTDRYRPISNREALGLLNQFVERYHLILEKPTVLLGGRFIAFSVRIGFFHVRDEIDENVTRLQFLVSHVPGYAFVVDFCAHRIVCMNSFLSALYSEGTEWRFRMPHITSLERRPEAERLVEAGIQSSLRYQNHARILADSPLPSGVSRQEAVRWFAQKVFDIRRKPDESDQSFSSRLNRSNSPVSIVWDSFVSGPGANLPTAQDTWWGAFQAVIHAVDHRLGRDSDRRTFEALAGSRVKFKEKALNLALEYAGGGG